MLRTVAYRLLPDICRGHALDIIKPHIRIKPLCRGELAHPSDRTRTGVVRREGERSAILLIEMRVGEVLIHKFAHIFRAGVNVRLRLVYIAYLHGCAQARQQLHQPDRALTAARFLPQSRLLKTLCLQQKIIEAVLLPVLLKNLPQPAKLLHVIAAGAV